MHPTTLLISLLPLISASSGSTAVQSDLQNLDNDAKSSASALNNYANSDGSLSTLSPSSNFQTLHTDCQTKANDTNNSPALSNAQWQTIADYVNNTLEADLAGVCTAAGKASAKTKASGLFSTLRNDVQGYKNDVGDLCKALFGRAPASAGAGISAACKRFGSDCKVPS